MYQLWILPHEKDDGDNYAIEDAYDDGFETDTLEEALVRAGEEDSGEGDIRIIKLNGEPIRYIHSADGVIVARSLETLNKALLKRYGEKVNY